MKVAVVGAGVAGCAAVARLVEAGFDTVWLTDVGGASEWTSGAADAEQSDPSLALSDELMRFAELLGLWRLPAGGCHVASSEGLLRWARGADHAVLDLTLGAGARIAVARLPWGVCDTGWLAKSLNESRWAQSTGTRFESVDIDVVGVPLTERMHGLDYAGSVERHFDAWCQAFAALDARYAAILVEPRLAAAGDVTARLSQRVGRPIGETLSAHSDLAGYRFEAARNALAVRLGVPLRRARVERIEVTARRVAVRWSEGELDVGAVVLATGDWLGGGIVLDALGAQPRLGLELEPPSLVVWVSGERPFSGIAASYGMDLQGLGADAFSSLGVYPSQQQASPCLVAGDLVANRVRTVLAAAQSGIDAARQLIEWSS